MLLHVVSAEFKSLLLYLKKPVPIQSLMECWFSINWVKEKKYFSYFTLQLQLQFSPIHTFNPFNSNLSVKINQETFSKLVHISNNQTSDTIYLKSNVKC